jgi:hypothetical protein
VHDHDPNAHEPQQADVAREALFQLVVDHGVAPVLHDEGAPLKASDVGQRFVQNLRFIDEIVHRQAGHTPGFAERPPPSARARLVSGELGCKDARRPWTY